MTNPRPALDSYAQPAGRLAGRFMRSLAQAQGDHHTAIAYVQAQNWLNPSPIVELHKAGVAGISMADLPIGEVGVDFLAALRPVSVLGRLTAARRVPLNVRIIAFGSGAVASQVAEGAPKPLTLASISGVTVSPHKTTAISVVTGELLNNAAVGTDEALATDLAAAVGASEDVAFLNPGTTGSILSTATATASTGSSVTQIDADLAGAIATLVAGKSDLSAAVWVLAPTTAAALALKRTSGGSPAYPGVSVIGGELLGLPVIVSASVSGFIALVDQAGVLVGENAPVAISYSRNTSLQQLDNPTNSASGTATTMVSMFQNNSVALRGEIWRGWVARAGAAAYISGVAF